MKFALIYFSMVAGKDRQRVALGSPVYVWPSANPPQHGYVRVQLVEAADEPSALDLANPLDDEAFLNSVGPVSR
jgi:hypothetical protein